VTAPRSAQRLQVVDGVDDAPAQLAICRAGAVRAMLLKLRPERPKNRAASGVRRSAAASRLCWRT